MRALVLTEDRRLALVDRPRPQLLEPHDVLTRVVQTGICGTDRSVLVGKFSAQPGVIMGHEAVGVVEEVGSAVSGLRCGDPVILNPTLYCGSCPACLRGRLNFCQNKAGTEVGIDRDGAFAEYIRLPDRFCHRTPEGMSVDRAVVVEPLACALNNIEAGGLRAGETTVVLGGGPIGIVCAMAASVYGAQVVVVEPDSVRQSLGRAVLDDDAVGSVDVLAPGRDDLEGCADLVIDTVGNLLEHGLRYLAPGGRIVVMGYHSTAVATIRPLQLLQRGLRVIGAGDYNSHVFPRAIELARRLPLEKLVTHRFGLGQFEAAFAALAATPGAPYSALKVVITPGSPPPTGETAADQADRPAGAEPTQRK